MDQAITYSTSGSSLGDDVNASSDNQYYIDTRSQSNICHGFNCLLMMTAGPKYHCAAWGNTVKGCKGTSL